MAHGVYPPGVRDSSGPIINQEQGLHQGWLIPLLPYLEEANVYTAVDQQLSVYDEKNEPARSMRLEILTCPSSTAMSDIAVSDYAGVHHDVEAPINVDQHGVLFLNSGLSHDDVTDGMRYTLFFGEKISEEDDDLGWMSGTRATLRNTGTPMNLTAPPEIISQPDDPVLVLRRQGLYVGGFGSWHPSGVVFAFGDGHVVFLVDSIDPTTYGRLGHRADGQLLDTSSLER